MESLIVNSSHDWCVNAVKECTFLSHLFLFALWQTTGRGEQRQGEEGGGLHGKKTSSNNTFISRVVWLWHYRSCCYWSVFFHRCLRSSFVCFEKIHRSLIFLISFSKRAKKRRVLGKLKIIFEKTSFFWKLCRKSSTWRLKTRIKTRSTTCPPSSLTWTRNWISSFNWPINWSSKIKVYWRHAFFAYI